MRELEGLRSSVQRLRFPSQPWGLEEAHNHTLRAGAPPLPIQPPWCPGTGRAPWKTGRSLNTVPFFRSFVLVICISRYGKVPLKAAGVCAHWTGSGAKGEPGPKEGRGGRGLPVTVTQLVPKAECKCSPLTMRKGREGVRSANRVGVSEG